MECETNIPKPTLKIGKILGDFLLAGQLTKICPKFSNFRLPILASKTRIPKLHRIFLVKILACEFAFETYHLKLLTFLVGFWSTTFYLAFYVLLAISTFGKNPPLSLTQHPKCQFKVPTCQDSVSWTLRSGTPRLLGFSLSSNTPALVLLTSLAKNSSWWRTSPHHKQNNNEATFTCKFQHFGNYVFGHTPPRSSFMRKSSSRVASYSPLILHQHLKTAPPYNYGR